MRRITTVALASVLAVAAAGAAAQTKPADLEISASGTETSGAAMRLDCDLDFVAVPSNVFVGGCRLTVGGDELVLGARDPDRQRVPTALLNGRLTIRGFADSATGRFAPMVERDAEGFPVFLEVDPLARLWAIRAGASGAAGEPVTSGVITSGRVFLVLP